VGIGGDAFMESYSQNAKLQHVEIIVGDVVAFAVHALAKAVGSFEGTPSELHQPAKEFLEEDGRKDKSWPKASHAFSRKLRRVEHNLREMSVDVQFNRRDERKIKITVLEK
jgi:hypothetical protein